MADDINKKISIDVQVNTDGHQQVDQYKASFDNLGASVSGLGKPLADLSKNISSLNNDMVKLVASNEKIAAKLVGNTQKAVDRQSKTFATANESRKKQLAEAGKIEDKAAIEDLARRFRYYGALGKVESDNYKKQQKELNTLLGNKKIDQQTYYKASEQLLKEHNERVAQMMTQFRNDSGAMPELQAKDTVKFDSPQLINTDIPAKIESVTNAAAPKPGIFKKLFGTILGYYKKNQDAQSKITEDGTTKTNSKVLADTVQNAQKIEDSVFSIITKGIQRRADAKVAALETEKNNELNNANLTSAQKTQISNTYKAKEDKIKLKAFKEQQKLSIAQAIINGAIAITKSEADLGPIAGTIAIAAIIANTAAQIATISSQKPPGMAKGGYFKSDGRGALLPGYSANDNTNAYLRSGEAVVVSEAMRDPWARNLVSAINVAYGGRDFSVPNPSRGYAIGGIFTDGGNANRYYNQPVNDNKNLANTIAYQMVNNFPPVYVDVKDINNQQNILAQTVNRVNL
jgi:hypothetical protein